MRPFSHSRIPFLLMFWVIFCLSLNFTILRSVRNTLAVVDLGNGSQMIPFFELFGALPAAILTTWVLTKLMNRFSLRSVFLITLMGFLTFFLLFACLIYPFFIEWQKKALDSATFSPSLVKGCGTAFSMLFYCLAELWKPALINILFWGLINNHVTIGNAKNLYAFLLFRGKLWSSFCRSYLENMQLRVKLDNPSSVVKAVDACLYVNHLCTSTSRPHYGLSLSSTLSSIFTA